MNAAIPLLFMGLLIANVGHTSENESMHSSCSDKSEATVVARPLKLLTLNVSHGRRTTINQILVGEEKTYRNLDAISELLSLADADLVALQEADAASRWSGGFDHVSYIAARANYACIVHGLHSTSWISSYGTAFLAHAEMLEPRSVQFKPSPPSKQKGYVSAQLVWHSNAGPVRITVVSVHFDFLGRKTRGNQVMEMVSELSSVDGPLIILGDLNSEWLHDESHVQMLASKLRLRAFDPYREDLGTYKKPNGSRLDWILISEELEFETYRVLPEVVSDHFAVYAELNFREQPE
jgi:endonuclease/exonuclease/phosphatase family metal-dependent hydrolase